LRGVRFVRRSEVESTFGWITEAYLFPHPQDHTRAGMVLEEVAQAFGFDTATDYLRALAEEGSTILKRLEEVQGQEG
jgi:hypothetical protein